MVGLDVRTFPLLRSLLYKEPRDEGQHERMDEEEEDEENGYVHEFISSNSHALNWYIHIGALGDVINAHDNGVVWRRDAMSYARSLTLVMYLHEHGARWHSRAMYNHALHGRLDCLVYAHEHGAPWHDTMRGASLGSLDCMVYADEHGAPWSGCEVFNAAGGNLDRLKYAHKHAPQHATSPFDCYTMQIAAKGHLECLEYTHEHGGSEQMDQKATHTAADGDHVECLQFLIERGCVYDARQPSILLHRLVVMASLHRRRSAIRIQRAWRAAAEVIRRRPLLRCAVSVIEDAYITWASRPGCGIWYKQAAMSFERGM